MKAALVTFHASHNFGSMLQAYATQELVSKYADVDIINFRMKSQREFYTLYQTKYGVMRFFRSLLMFPIQGQRKLAARRFEGFLSTYLNVTPMVEDYEGLEKYSNCYDVYISGSDQIWSNRVPEVKRSVPDYFGVYFLDFVRAGKKKISFASSIGEMTYEELLPKKELLKQYDYLSSREENGSKIIEKLTDKPVTTLIDPTLALDREEWDRLAGDKPLIDGDYVFLYTLRGIRPGLKWGKALRQYADKHGYKVVCIAPFFPIMSGHVTNINDAGPLEFLNLVKHAKVVFTDSFHGTAFSIIFNKTFYSLTKKDSADDRKLNLLRMLDLEDRAITSIESVGNLDNNKLNYSAVNCILAQMQLDSLEYLRKGMA